MHLTNSLSGATRATKGKVDVVKETNASTTHCYRSGMSFHYAHAHNVCYRTHCRPSMSASTYLWVPYTMVGEYTDHLDISISKEYLRRKREAYRRKDLADTFNTLYNILPST